GAFSFNGTNGTLLNMSNLTTFTWGGLTNRNFTIQPDTSINATVANTNIVYFARSSNQITGLTVTIGAALGASQGLDHAARVFLGTNNVINASSLNIGGFNGVGSVDFMGNVVGGSVKLRNTNGTDALPLLVVGNTSSGQRRGSGTLDLGVADALVTDTIVGNFQANSIANLTVTSSITMAGGSFNSASLYLGSMTNPAGSGNTLTNISNFQQNGGTSSVTLLRMGDNRATNNIGNTIAFQSTYNLLGSTALLRAQTIDAGTNANFGANSFHTLTMSNDATLRNASGVDLTVNGFTNTPAGLVNINLAGNGTVGADVDRKVIFGDKTLVSGPGALTKTGAGTLVLSGSNTYSGATTVSDGTLMVVRTNLTATITSSNISVVFSNTNSGTFPVLSGPLGGTYTGTVASTGLNTNQTATFDTTNGTVTVAAAKQAQTITGLASTDTKTYGASAYTLSVTKGASSSPLTFESSNTGVATVSTTGEVTIFGAGSTTIRVNQAGDENYMAATEVTQVLTVAKATPSITANPTASAIIAGNALSSSTLSGGTASVGGGFAWTSPSTVPSSTGSFSVTFTPADSANYNTTTSNVSVIVNSAGPTFDGAYPGKNLGDVAPNGLTYLMNYAFGGSDTTKPKLPVQDTADSTKLALVAYVRTGDTSLSVGGQAAASLDFSSPSSATYEVITPSDAPAGMEKRRYSVGVSGDRQFLRLIVTKQ
ncbi:MAG: hypothetical protein EBV83_02570, partial [Verrucomicrobia bacterium]|nr:hypothetical protein [Verrucomicrobiota bacterium]